MTLFLAFHILPTLALKSNVYTGHVGNVWETQL